MSISYMLKTIDSEESNNQFKEKIDALYDLITNRIVDSKKLSHIPKIDTITHTPSKNINNIYNNYKISIDTNLKLSIQNLNGNTVDLSILVDLFSINSTYTLNNLITFYNYLVDCNEQTLTKGLNNNETIEIIKGSHFYVIDVLKHYYFLVILYCFLLVLLNTGETSNSDNEFYKSLNDLVSIFMPNVLHNNPEDIILNYDRITDKISKSSNAYIKNQKLLKINRQHINDNKTTLSYLYNIIIVIIILTTIILLLSIYFRKNVYYLIIALMLVIILNIIFLTNVKIPYVEKFSNSNCNYDDIKIENNPKYLADKLYKQLCKLACGLHIRYQDRYVDSLYYGANKLQNEKHKYEKLRIKSKGNLLNTKDKINNDTLTFYQRKEYANLFIRLITLFIILLILLNIFGNESIIKIFGFVFFCLIFMVYLYNIKVISRTDTNKRYWN